jgi:hypothetical protein
MGIPFDLSGNDVTVASITTRALTSGATGIVERGPSYFLLKGVNFNSANTDNAVTITLPPGVARYAVASVWLNNASASISTATVSVRTGAGATGATIAAAQAITVTATATDTVNNAQSLTLTNAGTEAYNDLTLYVRVGTAQGSAATADVLITLTYLS